MAPIVPAPPDTKATRPADQIDGRRSIPSRVSLGHVCTPFVEPSASGLLAPLSADVPITCIRPPAHPGGVSGRRVGMTLLVPG